MAFFPDLTFYEYFRPSYGPMLAIGWLDKEHPYPQGKAPIAFVAKLAAILSSEVNPRVNLTRGFHQNELLPGDPEIKAHYQHHIPHLLKDYSIIFIGNGELHFAYESKFYGAPTMIYEYIVENSYLPPQAFIDAVLHGDLITEADQERYEVPKAVPLSTEEEDEIEQLLDEVEQKKEQGQLKLAKKMLTNALKKWPENGPLLLEYANTNVDLRKYREVLAAVKKYRETNPDFYICHALEGIAYFQQKDYPKAKEAFNQVLPIFRAEADHYNLIQMLYYMGMIEKAAKNIAQSEAYFREMEACDPSYMYLVDAIKKQPKRNWLLSWFRK